MDQERCPACERVLQPSQFTSEICEDCEAALGNEREARFLYLDIERTPDLSLHYGLKQNWMNWRNIVQEGTLISIQWAWNDRDVQTLCVSADDHRNDKALVEKAHELLNKADIVIGHNLDRYDLPQLVWRMLQQGLEPVSHYQTIDTLKEAKKLFKQASMSNSMANLCHKLGMPLKGKITQEQWNDFALNGGQEVLDEIDTYGAQDIVCNRDLYKLLRPWMKNHPHMRAFSGVDLVCRNCGSEELLRDGIHVTRSGTRYKQYKCSCCGAYTKGGRL